MISEIMSMKEQQAARLAILTNFRIPLLAGSFLIMRLELLKNDITFVSSFEWQNNGQQLYESKLDT